MPSKRTINLAPIGVKKIDLRLAAGGILLILLLASAFGKFLVADRLNAVIRAEGEVTALQSDIQGAYRRIAGYGDLEAEYAHYTYSGMTKEELAMADRAEVVRMVQKETGEAARLISWNLSGNLLTLSVAASDLQDINRMVKNLGEFEIVDLCSVTTAVKEDLQVPGAYAGVPEELAGADHIVRANILVYLKSAGEEAGK